MSYFKKIRFFLRLTLAFFKKRVGVVLIGVIIGVFAYFFFLNISKKLPRPRKVEKIGIVGKFTLSDVPVEILNKLSLGLTAVSEDGRVVPAVASRWQVSTDGRIYTFYFSENNYYWHDKEKFKPEDVNYNFKDANILPIDFQTLKIVLKEPFSSFPYIVSQPLFKKGLIGLGFYKVQKIEMTNQILKSILLHPVEKKSDLPILHYRFYSNDNLLKTAFRLGELNQIEILGNTDEFKNINNLSIKPKISENRQLTLFLNTAKPSFSDKSFRQATAYAIEKPADESRALGPVNPHSWVFNPAVKRYEKDQENSKQLLEKLNHKQDVPFQLYTFASLESEAKKIINELEMVGIKVELKITSFIPDDFDMFLAIQEIPNDPDQYLFWHSAQKLNITNFANPRVDKLLEDGRKEQADEGRRKIYFDFQRFLVEETPAVFLYYPTYYLVERK